MTDCVASPRAAIVGFMELTDFVELMDFSELLKLTEIVQTHGKSSNSLKKRFLPLGQSPFID